MQHKVSTVLQLMSFTFSAHLIVIVISSYLCIIYWMYLLWELQ